MYVDARQEPTNSHSWPIVRAHLCDAGRKILSMPIRAFIHFTCIYMDMNKLVTHRPTHLFPGNETTGTPANSVSAAVAPELYMGVSTVDMQKFSHLMPEVDNHMKMHESNSQVVWCDDAENYMRSSFLYKSRMPKNSVHVMHACIHTCG
jgi:hypothetical protein